jgi:hypothetical protein
LAHDREGDARHLVGRRYGHELERFLFHQPLGPHPQQVGEDRVLNPLLRALMAELREELIELDTRIAGYDRKIRALSQWRDLPASRQGRRDRPGDGDSAGRCGRRSKLVQEWASVCGVACPPFAADADYPFGHAKIEAVAALAQTAFLLRCRSASRSRRSSEYAVLPPWPTRRPSPPIQVSPRHQPR